MSLLSIFEANEARARLFVREWDLPEVMVPIVKNRKRAVAPHSIRAACKKERVA